MAWPLMRTASRASFLSTAGGSARGSGKAGQPLEIQLLEFPSAQALDAFMNDDRRQSLAGERDKSPRA